MTLIELQAVRQALRDKLAALERITPWCASCEHLASRNTCVKFGPVPEDFQREVGACPDWLHDGVPF